MTPEDREMRMAIDAMQARQDAQGGSAAPRRCGNQQVPSEALTQEEAQRVSRKAQKEGHEPSLEGAGTVSVPKGNFNAGTIERYGRSRLTR